MITPERLRAIVDHLTEEKPCSGCSDIIRAELLQHADELERDRKRIEISQFLSEMYAVMIDPLADGEIKVEETCKALLEAAKRDRQSEHDNQKRIAELEAALREVCLDAMGGTPDLFGPASGWDEWDQRAAALLNANQPANKTARKRS